MRRAAGMRPASAPESEQALLGPVGQRQGRDRQGVADRQTCEFAASPGSPWRDRAAAGAAEAATPKISTADDRARRAMTACLPGSAALDGLDGIDRDAAVQPPAARVLLRQLDPGVVDVCPRPSRRPRRVLGSARHRRVLAVVPDFTTRLKPHAAPRSPRSYRAYETSAFRAAVRTRRPPGTPPRCLGTAAPVPRSPAFPPR